MGDYMKKLMLALFFTVVACSQPLENQISILEKSTCNLPCWNNINTGQTSEQDALDSISALSSVEKESIPVTNKPWNIFDNQIVFSFSAKSGFNSRDPWMSKIDISNGVARVVTLCGELHTTMGEIVQEIGEPEGIISGGSIAGGRDVILVNPKAGVSYWYSTAVVPEEMEFVINPKIELRCLSLFDPMIFEQLMDAGMFSMGHYDAEETLKVMYSWDGYGNLDEKYPPRQP
jgi:hypothetical protein